MWHGKIFYGKCFIVVVWQSSTYKTVKVIKLCKKIASKKFTFFLIIISWWNSLNRISEYWKSRTLSVISEILNPIYRLGKILFEKAPNQDWKDCTSSLPFLPPSNFAVFDSYFLCRRRLVEVARYSFPRSIPPKFEHKQRLHKQRFGN